MCWALITIVALIYAGLYCVLMYPDDVALTREVKEEYRRMRYLGWALLGLGFAGLIYSYYTGIIRFKANLPPDCELCKRYARGNKKLRTYKVEEYPELARIAKVCDNCSKECTKDVQLLKKYGITDTEKKAECIEVTKAAFMAKNELARLEPEYRKGGINAWKIAVETGGAAIANQFPQIPTHEPK